MADKLTTVFDREDRMWTHQVGRWGNDDLMEAFDTLEKLDRHYGPLYDPAGDDIDVLWRWRNCRRS